MSNLEGFPTFRLTLQLPSSGQGFDISYNFFIRQCVGGAVIGMTSGAETLKKFQRVCQTI
jgi:hypothetical protein